jgi:hypothetical protein
MLQTKIYKTLKPIFHKGSLLKVGQEFSETDFINNEVLEGLIKKRIIIYSHSLKHIDNAPKWKKRLAIITGVWQRPEVFEMFANATNKLKHNDIDIVVIVAGSEGAKSRQMVEDKGFIYIEIENQPLAQKMNATMLKAQELNVDFCLCVGSDDLITNELLEVYYSYMIKNIDYVAVLDWYFYDTQTKAFTYWGGYTDTPRIGHTCGAGRLISSNLLNKWGWAVWENKHSTILDDSMQNKLKTTPHTSEVFRLKDKNVFAFDVKSAVNMTPFELWENTNFVKGKEETELRNKFNSIVKCAE